MFNIDSTLECEIEIWNKARCYYKNNKNSSCFLADFGIICQTIQELGIPEDRIDHRHGLEDHFVILYEYLLKTVETLGLAVLCYRSFRVIDSSISVFDCVCLDCVCDSVPEARRKNEESVSGDSDVSSCFAYGNISITKSKKRKFKDGCDSSGGLRCSSDGCRSSRRESFCLENCGSSESCGSSEDNDHSGHRLSTSAESSLKIDEERKILACASDRKWYSSSSEEESCNVNKSSSGMCSELVFLRRLLVRLRPFPPILKLELLNRIYYVFTNDD